ncbi:MAG TPA: lysozyme inhibitor LprI family protein [Dongiaceae bacterium]
MRSAVILCLGGLALVAASTLAFAQDNTAKPSFDCAAATQPLDILICGDAPLAELDRTLAESYHAALAGSATEAQSKLRDEQRAWAANRAASCGVGADFAGDAAEATGCLAALYRARIVALQPAGGSRREFSVSGYAWLMGDWTVAAIREQPVDPVRADAAKAQLGRTVHFAEAPMATPGGAACSFPRYGAEPAPGPQFGDLGDYPTAVMVRVSCVGIALLDVVRLTDERILLGEGEVIFELERRH